MLELFRRHTKDCKFTGRKHRNCQCPIAVEGTLHGRMIRKSLDLRSWEDAQKLVRDWEANPEGGGITVKITVGKYLSDAEARNISDSQMRKPQLVLGELENKFSAVAIRSVAVDDLRTIREAWAVTPVTMQKRPEMLRSFFRFIGFLMRRGGDIFRVQFGQNLSNHRGEGCRAVFVSCVFVKVICNEVI